MKETLCLIDCDANKQMVLIEACSLHPDDKWKLYAAAVPPEDWEDEDFKYFGVPKRTLQLTCRCCGMPGWYEDLKDDEDDYDYGTCGECDVGEPVNCDKCGCSADDAPDGEWWRFELNDDGVWICEDCEDEEME